MRISEWSSDVCSSDLSERLGKGDCQAVGGIQYYGDGRVQSDGGTWRPWFARAVSIGHGRKLSDPIDPDAIESSINYITGASMLVSRAFRSEARRVGKECVSTCRSRWSPYP